MRNRIDKAGAVAATIRSTTDALGQSRAARLKSARPTGTGLEGENLLKTCYPWLAARFYVGISRNLPLRLRTRADAALVFFGAFMRVPRAFRFPAS
jgi:hypothetical protein